MPDLPFVETGQEAAEGATRRAKQLIGWLPTPKSCEECGHLCDASVTYDPQLCEPVKSWVCEPCDRAYRRMEPWDSE